VSSHRDGTVSAKERTSLELQSGVARKLRAAKRRLVWHSLVVALNLQGHPHQTTSTRARAPRRSSKRILAARAMVEHGAKTVRLSPICTVFVLLSHPPILMKFPAVLAQPGLKKRPAITFQCCSSSCAAPHRLAVHLGKNYDQALWQMLQPTQWGPTPAGSRSGRHAKHRNIVS